ncbi:hypothetical protein [Peptostreptococcus porci]|uniref:Uncharacterized protein n=2 Tax=Peptostreptococcus porci TaxID=2652282 RepID=A0A6N7WZ99_9FIRM|nr:hypothetical protein [Peptostreptococcus porci]MDY2794091.1 hypothetical protein [Peptostreptococcus porci]MDY4561829.1 hypothetical protein [Peptostreptococcus porci]MDY5435253.1 hypothetical protein [Peptostreptococcus porci]MDY5480529.1 hypothetical protein [Peptostreptococcus porci]MST62205.1 hypothetical protein [Peptostreptococcus porci]
MDLNNNDIEKLNSDLELSCITNLLLEIIKKNHEDMIYDINFIFLDKALDIKTYEKIFVELLGGYQKEFISKGIIPNIEDIHEKLIKIISINDNFLEGISYLNKDKYNLDFTKKFLTKIEEKNKEFTFLTKLK